MKDEQKKLIQALGLGGQLGFLIVLPLILFLLLGLFLDEKFNTFPLCLISLIVLSLIATFFHVRYLVLPIIKKKVEDNKQ